MSRPTADQLRAAYDAGQASAVAGQHVSTCPYDPGPLRTWWLRGRVDGRAAAG